MNKEPKGCKICGAKRFVTLSICYKHYKERERKKKEEKAQKALLRKTSTKKHQESERKKLHRKCWNLMSILVRSEDANADGYTECYTCGAVKHWKELHAGHYKHGTLDFDRRNLKPQCNKCNTYLGGKLDVYTMNLIDEYGIEWVKQLERDASQHPGYRLEDLKIIYAELTKSV